MNASVVLARSDLNRWDVKGARAAAFRLAHPGFRRLGEVVSDATVLVRPFEEPDRLWPIYGVSNRRGIVLNELREGRSFKTPQKRIEKDWFFHNPTRANVGSLGRVGSVEPHAITSPEYQVWKIDREVEPDFMELLLKLSFFREQIDFNRVGSVKERLFVDNLRDIVVPIPPVERQHDYMQRKKGTEDRARALDSEAKEARGAIDSFLLQALGLERLRTQSTGKASMVFHSAMDRWGVSFSQLSSVGNALDEGHFNSELLGALVTGLQYGTSAKASLDEEDGLPVLRMGNLVDGELDFSELKYVALTGSEADSLMLRDGDILINRTNSKELVGKCAVFHSDAPFVFASYLIRARVKQPILDPDYLAIVLNSSIGRVQIDRVSRQSLGMANLNAQEIRALRIPLPSLSVQHQISSEVTALRARAAELTNAAEKLRADALSNIERDLLVDEAVKRATD